MTPKTERYFEITLSEAREWNMRDYIFFVVEILYSTIIPFFAGMLFVSRKEFIWLIFLIFPIQIRFTASKNLKTKKKTKKLFWK